MRPLAIVFAGLLLLCSLAWSQTNLNLIQAQTAGSGFFAQNWFSNWQVISLGAVFVMVGLIVLAYMAGHVVCAFMPDGFAELQRVGMDISDGAAQIVNLYGGGTKPDPIDGLIYYGKGGTSVVQPAKYAFKSPVDAKFKQNIDKQSRLLADANMQNLSRDVMRMMYWTQTGMVRSIKGRDEKAWTTESKDKLKQLWADGGYDYMKDNVPRAFGLESHSTNFKLYLPNFIMIDFANKDKGQTIYNLNLLSRPDIIQLNASLA